MAVQRRAHSGVRSTPCVRTRSYLTGLPSGLAVRLRMGEVDVVRDRIESRLQKRVSGPTATHAITPLRRTGVYVLVGYQESDEEGSSGSRQHGRPLRGAFRSARPPAYLAGAARCAQPPADRAARDLQGLPAQAPMARRRVRRALRRSSDGAGPMDPLALLEVRSADCLPSAIEGERPSEVELWVAREDLPESWHVS